MGEERAKDEPTAISLIRSLPEPRIDVARHLAQRAAVAEVLDRQRVFVSRKSYSKAGLLARVLIDGEYFDVPERDLGLLKEGFTPEELGIAPVRDQDEWD